MFQNTKSLYVINVNDFELFEDVPTFSPRKKKEAHFAKHTYLNVTGAE